MERHRVVEGNPEEHEDINQAKFEGKPRNVIGADFDLDKFV